MEEESGGAKIAPLEVAGQTWVFTEFSVNRFTHLMPDAVMRCDVEMLERRRQFYRPFTLYYCDEFFSTWCRRDDDYEFVAAHARLWLGKWIAFRQQLPNLSDQNRIVVALLHF